jgi:Tol biopolymer transport system component
MAADQIVDSNIWMVPVDPSGAPVALTEEDIGPAYGYSLSPDGRFIAYQSEKELGSSLWLVDLGIELRAEGREDR